MNRRAFLSMIGLAAPTYFLAPRGGWVQLQPHIASYADYLEVSDFPLLTTVSYDVKFVAKLMAQTHFTLLNEPPPLPYMNAGSLLMKANLE